MPQQNQTLLQALNDCVAACEMCASACLQEEDVKMMVRCIQLDRDCAAICALTASYVARGSEQLPQLLQVCADICRACGEECARHDMDHCQECAEACRRCEEVCRQGVAVVA